MTILQWNSSGYNNNMKNLQILIKQKLPSIICLQENHFIPKYQPPITKLHTVRIATLNL